MHTNQRELLLLKDEVFQIIGCAIEVLNTLESRTTREALRKRAGGGFGLRKIPFGSNSIFDVLIKGRRLASLFLI